MSTAYAFDPVRRPLPARPVEAAPVLAPAAPSTAAAPRALPLVRPKVLAASVVLAGAVCVIVAQLLLSIATAGSAYRLAELQQRSDVLAHQQQVAAEALAADAAPQRLAARAKALGMVPDDSPAYLDASTGRVLGSTGR
ncbi:hypothetical protein [Amnibacterium kyonggiense]|uniref:Cell division protein FtsL n=1 Tax=Amnibacterium kyonggiense TaxID=595671 RepID=A0A4R7FKY4_9MICO|nr:hypothetical protein [Amnibacterium kyonggiense]TDS77018.1 hypothetical protein CLV52_1957 [Amnibacterium kyonggiense]